MDKYSEAIVAVPARYNELLAGKTIRAASSCGGIVEIDADDMVLSLSVQMHYHPAVLYHPAGAAT